MIETPATPDSGAQEPVKRSYAERLEDSRHAEEMFGFKIHLAVYVGVMTLLLIINFFDQDVWWAQWPLLGWGFGLFCHWFAVWYYYGKRVSSSERSRLRQPNAG